MTNPRSVSPWYKQPWLWFLLVPLIATVLYSTVFISASLLTSDGLVKDDYYKQAKEIHRDNSKDQIASEMGLIASLRLDTVTGDINLEITSSTGTQLPVELILDVIHPTQERQDAAITLRQVQAGIYVGNLTINLLGKKYLILRPLEHNWQLFETVYPPYDRQTVHFQAK